MADNLPRVAEQAAPAALPPLAYVSSRHAHRLAGVEAGRGIAAGLVVCDHATGVLHGVLGVAPLGGVFAFGHAGVDFFFVLSGFIICHVHWNDIGKADRVKAYLRKRFVRIYPTYWIALILFIGLFLYSPDRNNPMSLDLMISSVFLYPYGGEPILRAGWTLRHELLFYALFATVILHRNAGRALLLAWAGCITWNIAITMITGVPFWHGVSDHVFFRVFNIEFFFGVAVTYLVRHHKSWCPICALVVGVALFTLDGMYEVFGPLHQSDWAPRHLGYALGAALALYGAVIAESEGRLQVPQWMFKIGSSSYSIYLIHMLPVLVLSFVAAHAKLTGASPTVWFVVIVSSSVACGMAFSSMVEQPILRLARREIGTRSLATIAPAE